MIIVMKWNQNASTHMSVHTTQTHTNLIVIIMIIQWSHNDKKNKHNIIRMIIVMKWNQNASTHMYVHTYNIMIRTHTNVIVIIMITQWKEE